MYDKSKTNTFKALRAAQKSFPEIEAVVGEILKINDEQNLDQAWQQNSKPVETKKADKKAKSEKKEKAQPVEKPQPKYMHPQTKQAMKSATLPSSDHWNKIAVQEPDSDKKVPKRFKQVVWSEPYSIWSKPFSLISLEGTDETIWPKELEFVNIAGYNYIVNTALPGLNQHKSNPNIYFLVSPESGWLDKAPDPNKVSKEEYKEATIQLGKAYLAKAINCVQESRGPDAKISCIVLGDRYLPDGKTIKPENMEVYDQAWFLVDDNDEPDEEYSYFNTDNKSAWFLANERARNKIQKESPKVITNSKSAARPKSKQLIDQYDLFKEESKAQVDVRVYNIDAVGSEADLTSKDLDTLAQVNEAVQKKGEEGEAIIVHCRQGLDRTGMLIFAFILAANYEEFFTGKDSAQKIYEAYKTLQWSRSPQSLMKIHDLVNAIYLAHTLNAISIEKQCLQNLGPMTANNNNSQGREQALLVKLQQAESNSEKIKILEAELEQLGVAKNKKDDSTYRQKRRSLSISSKQSSDLDAPETLKRSSSTPEDLQQEPKEVVEKTHTSSSRLLDKKLKQQLLVNSQRTDKLHPEKSSSEDSKISSSTSSNSNSNTNSSKSSSLSPRSTPLVELSSGSEVKSKSFKNPMSFFENNKIKKRNTEGSKESKAQMPSEHYVLNVKCLVVALKHRIKVEEALQDRIHPQDSSRFTIS